MIHPDHTTVAVKALLDHVDARLAAAGAPVLRAFIAPGGTATWDTCCEGAGGEGQAWVLVSRFVPVSPFPQDDSGARRCKPHEYGAELQVGVMRCAHVVDDQGRAPTAAQVTGDAEKVHRDRVLVLQAILCDFISDDTDPGTFRLGAWTPLGPGGGCVGGAWALTIAAPACRCPELEEAP